MTRVTHLSYRTTGGGAARSATRMHETMLGLGVESELLAVENDTNVDHVRTTQPSRNPFRRLYRHTLRTYFAARDHADLRSDAPCGVFTSDRSFRRGEVLRDIGETDVIHLHFVAEMFDESIFLPAATRVAPVVWTMRDMRAITGGCHCDLGCGRFRTGCGNCPQLTDSAPRDLSHRIWRRREQTLSKIDESRLTFVAPSQWLAGEFRDSPLCNRFPLQVIPNGVDTDVFRPGDSAAVRDQLGIDQDSFVVLFNSFSLNTALKGGELLLAALRLLGERLRDDPSHQKIQLLAVGEGAISEATGIPTKLLGYLDTDAELAAAYQAADLFVIPSLQDNCPNTVLEAFASGVPVVGFKTSGIPDLVRPGETGLLAEPFNSRDLAEKIWQMSADPSARGSMASRCREFALTDLDRRIEAARYLELYEQ